MNPMHSLLLGIAKYSYLEIFIALGLGIVGLPLPDETLMAYAGFLVFQGTLNYPYTIMRHYDRVSSWQDIWQPIHQKICIEDTPEFR
jgi:hypothetical protein